MGPAAGCRRLSSGVAMIVVALSVTACGAEHQVGDTALEPVATVAAAEQTIVDTEVQVHPVFKEHFTAELYSDPGARFGPFASDGGQELLRSWSGRTAELTPSSTVRDLLVDFEDDPAAVDTVLFDSLVDPGIDPEGDAADAADAADSAGGSDDDAEDTSVDGATTVLGAGFTLLVLTGHIDAEGEQVTLEALDTLEDHYGPQPELDQMRQDLLTFTGPTTS